MTLFVSRTEANVIAEGFANGLELRFVRKPGGPVGRSKVNVIFLDRRKNPCDARLVFELSEKNHREAFMRFTCPNCSQLMECPDELAGRRATCPKCGQKLCLPVPPRPTPIPTNKTVLGKLENGEGEPETKENAIATPPSDIPSPTPAIPSPAPVQFSDNDPSKAGPSKMSSKSVIVATAAGAIVLLSFGCCTVGVIAYLHFGRSAEFDANDLDAPAVGRLRFHGSINVFRITKSHSTIASRNSITIVVGTSGKNSAGQFPLRTFHKRK